MDASFGGSFDTVTLAQRCRRGASTPSPEAVAWVRCLEGQRLGI